MIYHNVADWIPHPGTGAPVLSRIPKDLRTALNANAQQRGLHSAGCELRFRLTGEKAVLRLRAVEVGGLNHGGGLAQVLFGDFSLTYFPVMEGQETVVEIVRPDRELLNRAAENCVFSPELVRVLLPTHAAIADVSVEGEITSPEPDDIPERRLLTYGSSITQGSGSLTSRESWAGILAQRLGMDHLNLGFGGGCHCEPEMTDYLVDRDDWDVATLETGINMLGLDAKETDRRIVDLITRFATAHREKWTFCVGVFPCKEDVMNGYAGRARKIHALVRRTVEHLDLPKLRFIDGREALTPSLDMTVDLTHPSPAGMISIGTWAHKQIQAML